VVPENRYKKTTNTSHRSSEIHNKRQISWLTIILLTSLLRFPQWYSGFGHAYSSGGCNGLSPFSLFIFPRKNLLHYL